MDDEDSPIPGDPFDSSDDDDIEAGSGGKVLLKSLHENKHKARELPNGAGGQLQTWSRLTYLCLSSFILGCMVSIIGPTVPILLRQNNGPSFSMGFSVVSASAAGSVAGILSGRFSLFLEDWNKQFRLISLIYMCFSVGGAVPLLIYALNVSESPSTATDFTTSAITKRSLSNDSSLGNGTFGKVVNESVTSWTSVSPAPVKPKFVDSAGLKTDETYAARKEKELKHIELNAKAKEKMQTQSTVTEPANRTSEFNSTTDDIELPNEKITERLLNNSETTTIATVTTLLSTLTTTTPPPPTTTPYVSTLTSEVISTASWSETTIETMSTVLPDEVISVRDVVVKIVENDRLELAYHTAAGMGFFVLAILMAVYCASCRMCSGSAGVGRPQMIMVSCENAGSVYQLKTLTVGLLFVLFIAGVEWTLATITVSYLLVEHQRSLSDSVALCAVCWCLSCGSRLVSLCCSFSRHLLGVCLVISALLSGVLALSRSYSAVAVLLCAYAASVGPLLPATFHWFNQQAGLPAQLVTVWLLAINLSRALVPLAVGALVEIGMRNFQTALLFMTSLSLLLFIPLEKWTKQSKHYSDALSVSMSRRGRHNFFNRRDHYYTSFKANRATADRLSTNENNNSDDDVTDDDEILHFYKPHSKSRLPSLASLLFGLTMQYRVTVKTLDGHDRAFELDPETTVGQFQERIAAEMNVPVDRQRVIFHGRVLDPSSTVKDLGKLTIDHLNEKVIHLVEKMEGPPPAPPSTTSTTNAQNAQQAPGNDSGSNAVHPHIFLGTVALPPNDLTSEQIYTIIREVLDEFGFSGQAATIQLQEPEGSDDVAEIVQYARRMQGEHSLSNTAANDKESDASSLAEIKKEGEESAAMHDGEEKPPESSVPVDQSTQTDANASSASNSRRQRNATFQDLANLFSFLSTTVRDLLALLQNCELLLEAERHFEPFAQIRVMIHQQNSNADARTQSSGDIFENQNNNAEANGRTLSRRDDSSALRRVESTLNSPAFAESLSRDLTNMIHSVNEATGSMMDFVTIMNRGSRHSSDNHVGNYLRVRHGNTLMRHPSERPRGINRFYGQVLNLPPNSTVNISFPSRSGFGRTRQQRQQPGADTTTPASSGRSGGGAAPFRNFHEGASAQVNTSNSQASNASTSRSGSNVQAASRSTTATDNTAATFDRNSPAAREIRSTIEQLANAILDTMNEMQPFELVNSLYRLLANSLVAGDVVDILQGNYETLDRFRSIMRRYFIENLLNGNERPSQEDMRQAAHRAAESEIPYCRRLAELLPEQNEIDLLSSLISCEEDTVYRLLLLCFGKDSNEAFGQRLYKNLLLGVKQTLAVVVYTYAPNGEVDERIVRIMTSATLRDVPEYVRRAFDSFGAGVLQTVLAETLLPREEVSGFFVKKHATTAERHENRQGSAASENNNILTTAADAFAGEPMIVEPDSVDNLNNQPTELDLQQVALCNCTIEKDDDTPSVRASINSLPPEVIASLPIVVQSGRLNLDDDQRQLFHDALANAITSSESAESAPAVRNLLNSSEIVSEAVENFMKEKIQRRLRYDRDFTPVLFPSSYEYFKP
ncbi:ubiquitin family protein [Trichinella spiralis]|uniref:ubiquitin family protein n=1 Tax=Trichinella spiralis TaxID=6334 RepID=UPI0001EFB9CF|nr:ubiquitin family protein [Trichinella spiralis]